MTGMPTGERNLEPIAARSWAAWAIRYLSFGTTVTILLLVAKLSLEATAVGEEIGQSTRSYLLRLLPPFREQGADAIVVDISHLPGGNRDLTTGEWVPTPRDKLQALIDTLVTLRAAAIGVDIDFGGTSTGWVSPKDGAFFDYCLAINEDVPIRLAVVRSLGAEDDRWLVSSKYAPLAASGALLRPDSGRIPVWIENEHTGKRLMTLGASLANATKALHWGPLADSFVFDTVTTRKVFEEPAEFVAKAHEALVNFSVVRQLSREYIPKAEPSDLIKYASRISGRMVLIGDVEDSSDLHPIPGDRVNHPGVLIHAAQAHTFTSEPVYEFGHRFRILLDIALPVLAMLVVVAVRRRGMHFGQTSLLELRVLAVIAALVALAAFVLVYFFRVFWPDVLLVLTFLFLHRPTEHQLVSRIQRHWGIA